MEIIATLKVVHMILKYKVSMNAKFPINLHRPSSELRRLSATETDMVISWSSKLKKLPRPARDRMETGV